MYEKLKIIFTKIILLVSFIFCLYGFTVVNDMFGSSNQFTSNILNLGEIISLILILGIMYKTIELILSYKLPLEIVKDYNYYLNYFEIFFSFFFNSILFKLIFSIYFYLIFEFVLIIIVILPQIYINLNKKNKLHEEINDFQIKFLSTKDLYFTPYFDYLFYQYNYKRYIGFINLYLIFGIIIISFLSLLSNDFTNFFKILEVSLILMILWLIFILLGFVPTLIFLSYRLKYEFRDLFKACNAKDLDLLQEIYKKFDYRLQLSIRKEKNKVLISYFKALILANTQMYTEALEILDCNSKLALSSMAIKYEFFNLMGQIHFILHEKDEAEKNILESISGFKRLNYFAPIKSLESFLELIRS